MKGLNILMACCPMLGQEGSSDLQFNENFFQLLLLVFVWKWIFVFSGSIH